MRQLLENENLAGRERYPQQSRIKTIIFYRFYLERARGNPDVFTIILDFVKWS